MSFKPYIRPEVEAFKAYTPGLSIDSVKQKYGLSKVIKLASNENPLGISPVVKHVLKNSADLAFRYPGSGNSELCLALANYHKVKPERIIVGNGSDEIIDLILRITASSQQHNVVAFKPCFGIYSTQARLCGLELRQVSVNPDFSFDFDKLLAQVDADTAVVFVTTPDNPSGFCPKLSDLTCFAQKLPSSCLLVVDEAYIDFCDDEAECSILSCLDKYTNVAVLRTFSKSRGLAGLRLGYGIVPEFIADYYWRIRLPFSVNILAEQAGLAALQDDFFYQQTLSLVKQERSRVTEELCKLGCKVYPSQTNFIMFEPTKLKNDSAAYVFESLLSAGIIIRPLTSYGFKNLLRVSIGTEEENTIFLTQLNSIFN